MDRGITDLESRGLESLIHPISHLYELRNGGAPLGIVGGDGIYAIDTRGNRLIEATAGAWCMSLGYDVPELADAASLQIRKLAHASGFFGRTSESVVMLAERLKEVAPMTVSKVFFTASGSEANDTQARLLWYMNEAQGKPRKRKIIARHKGYHGSTVFAASLTGLSAFHAGFGRRSPDVIHVSAPDFDNEAVAGETQADFCARLAAELEATIVHEGPETVAAFIAEPVMAAGGVIVPPEDYFPAIQRVLSHYEVRLIADEVVCGFGRTGRLFGCETYRIAPASMTVAKQLSAAVLPIGAVLADEELSDVIIGATRDCGLLGHGFTYGGHPVSAAVALRTLELYEERRILAHVAGVAPVFRERLRAFVAHPLVSCVSCVGLIGALQLREPDDEPAVSVALGSTARSVAGRCRELGLIARQAGNRLCFCPPLIITDAQVHEMFDIVATALDEQVGQ